MSRGLGRNPRREPEDGATDDNNELVERRQTQPRDRAGSSELENSGDRQNPAPSKSSSLKETLLKQFRKAARAVAERGPVPKPRTRRRGDTHRAFAPAAKFFARRVSKRAITQAVDFVWDSLNWLQLWEWNDAYEVHEEFDSSSPQHYLSLHL